MDPALKSVSEHMKYLGRGALAHANRHAAYSAMENAAWPELAVLQAAHAAELFIKARIAQEHPLLIFEKVPFFGSKTATKLDFAHLFEHGRTVQWSDLPERLWAATGIQLIDLSAYKKFGALRNGIQHFAAPIGTDVRLATLQFVFNVIDPFINDAWGLYAVDHDEDYEPYVYFVSALVQREIPFLVSTAAAKRFKHWDVDWNGVSAEYRDLIELRVKKALKQPAASQI